MASISKLLKEEIVLDILKESDKCVISDSSDDGDDGDNCEDDIAVADTAVDEEARWRKKAKVIFLATLTITVVLFGRTWNIVMGNVNIGDET
jgi:hypothetical protein